VFFVPAVYIVYVAGGPVLLSMIPVALQTGALIVSASVDRTWGSAASAAKEVP
jgi:hypothetical protein